MDGSRTDRTCHRKKNCFRKEIIIGDKSMAHAQAAADLLNTTGFDAVAMETDLSSRESILSVIAEAQKYGNIRYLVNAAGVSPSQASVETILKVDLYGTAVLLEEVGKVIAEGGSGVTISSQSGHRMPALTPEEDMLLATTPTEELLSLELLQPEHIQDSLHAYQMAKRCNVKRVMAEAVNGENVMPALIPFHRALLSLHWLLMSSMVREETFTRICLRNVLPDVPELRMKWLMWQSSCWEKRERLSRVRIS